jgi:hypothetical protein
VSHCRFRNRGTGYGSESGMKADGRWHKAIMRPSPPRLRFSGTQWHTAPVQFAVWRRLADASNARGWPRIRKLAQRSDRRSLPEAVTAMPLAQQPPPRPPPAPPPPFPRAAGVEEPRALCRAGPHGDRARQAERGRLRPEQVLGVRLSPHQGEGGEGGHCRCGRT